MITEVIREQIKTNKTMKLEQQVLSVEQVQELKELGFDVKNYYLDMSKKYGYYPDDHFSISGEVDEKLIDDLFEILKYCLTTKK